MVEIGDRNTGRAYAGRSYGTGESLDLWGGLLGWREVRFENARTLFTTQSLWTPFL